MHWPSFFLGARHFAPLLLGAFPFGVLLGVTVAESSVPNWAGFLSGPLVFGGAAQLVAITLLGEGAGPASALVAALVVNARHFMYSAGLVVKFREQPRWFRWVGPYFLVDQMFALTSVRNDEPQRWRSYYLGIGVLAAITWMVAIGSGIVAGAFVPTDIGLEFGIPLLFIGLAVPALVRRPAIVAAVVGVGVAVLASGVPNRGAILIGGLAGMLAGAAAERAA
jgi:4-azaleucine resistance transporter AzlC